MPSLLTDGSRFLINVLLDATFQRDGILFGSDPAQSATGKARVADNDDGNIQWAVVDPRRHILYVWSKTTQNQDDFTVAARALGASCVSNGSFNEYKGGSKGWSTIKVGLSESWSGLKFLFSAHDLVAGFTLYNEVTATEKENWSGSKAQGHIFGAREKISETQIDRPSMHYFGRKAGRDFTDYIISLGEAPPIEEVIGGLFRTVKDYVNVEVKAQTIGAGFWGLAPLTTDQSLIDAGIGDAIAQYTAKDTLPQPKPACVGLIVAAFGWEDVVIMGNLLIAARVKDAVRVDGNDSILLGHQNTLLYGDHMGDAKRYYNRWGYQFRPG